MDLAVRMECGMEKVSGLWLGAAQGLAMGIQMSLLEFLNDLGWDFSVRSCVLGYYLM